MSQKKTSSKTEAEPALYDFSPIGPIIEVNLIGFGSRVRVDGLELRGVVDVKVMQPLEDSPEVTIVLRASQVRGFSWNELRKDPAMKALRQR